MISVIVPVYNTEKYLEDCVNSILNQTYKDIEILLVDDGSSDKSPEICDRLSTQDGRIKVFHKPNGGVSSARNLGLEKAEGELITFADSDDILTPELLNTLYNCMVKENVQRVCGGYAHFYEDGYRVYRKTRIPDGKYQTSEILTKMIDDGTMSGFLFSGVYNSLYVNKLIKKYNIRFNEGIKYNEDGLFSFEYALHTDSMYSLRSMPLYLYRQHSNSATKKRVKGNKYSRLHDYLRSLDFDKEKYKFEEQMQRRKVTIALWEIMDICKSETREMALNSIKEVLNDKDLAGAYSTIDISNLNTYKKLYYYLMKNNHVQLLYILTRHLLPVFTKRISR